MKIYIFFIAIFANRGSTQDDQCPAGPTRPSKAILCYAPEGLDFAFKVSEYKKICCKRESLDQCTHTGMKSGFYTEIKPSEVLYALDWKSNYREAFYHYTYQVNRGDRKFLCAYPIGYLWYNTFAAHPYSPNTYLPVDHFGTTSQLRTCQANQDCGAGQFCGDVINFSYDWKMKGTCKKSGEVCSMRKWCNDCIFPFDKLPNVDLTQHFCYKLPNIVVSVKFQFVLQPSKRNLDFCETDNDCTRGVDTVGNCHINYPMWSEFVPNPDTTLLGERKSKGICLQVIPISYTFSHMFDQLSATDKYGDKGKQYLAVGYGSGGQIKSCSKNADCPDKQFCGNAFSVTQPANFDSVNKFCFAVPDIAAPHNSNTKYTILPESLNLVACDNNADCRSGGTDGNSFCYTGTGHQYAKLDVGSTKKLYKGLCVEAKTCDMSSGEMVWELGGGPIGTNSCDKNADCDGGGNTKIGDNAKDTFQGVCVKNMTVPGANLCCYQKICPDAQTPPFSEPRCRYYDDKDSRSGRCPQNGAMCYYGHCCPNARIDANGKFVKPEYSYQTNQTCEPGVRPPKFLAGYCDPDVGKVVIIGTLSTEGIPLTPTDPSKQCVTDAECSTDKSKLCIYENAVLFSFAYCHHNPAVWKPPKKKEKKEERPLTVYEGISLVVVYFVLVLIVLFLAVFSGVVIYYKLKERRQIQLEVQKMRKTEEKRRKDVARKNASTTNTTTTKTGSTVTPSVV